MIIYGKEIAEEIKESLRREVLSRKNPPELVVVVVGSNPVVDLFVRLKKKFADAIGVPFHEWRFSEDVDPAIIISRIKNAGAKENTGIIVQLPLPKEFPQDAIIDAIPVTHDVDVLSSASITLYEDDGLLILPPVVGAIKEILFRGNVFVGNKKVVVVGRKKLVGAPAAVWFKRHEANVSVLGRDTLDISLFTKDADIIVLGAGSPGLLQPDMIKTGAVVIDAGTSEAEGKTVGDADPSCAEKASVFTPVPGGVGPLTVAMLFKNLLELTASKLPQK